LARLVAKLDDPKIGLVGPQLRNTDGSLQQSCASIPNVVNSIAAVLGLPRFLPDGLRRRWAPVLWSHTASTVTGWVGGACMVMRRSDFEAVRGFSERTFMYGEDLELCYQVRALGLRVWYEADVKVVHHGDQSSKLRWSDAETSARTALGELAFFRQRYGGLRSEGLRFLYAVGYGARAGVLRRLGRPDRAQTYSAMARALAGAPGRSKAGIGPRSTL
jgi:GT2 family glycosyltransferase